MLYIKFFLYFLIYIIEILQKCYCIKNDKIKLIGEIKKKLFKGEEINNLEKENLINFLKWENYTLDLNELREKEEFHTVLWDLIFDPQLKNSNILKYKDLLLNHSNFLNENKFSNDLQELLSTIHYNLYKWLYGFRYSSLKDIINSSNGKGIVICTPNRYVHFVRSNIDTFRYVLNITTPIEIFYNGESDLSKENRELLKQYTNVYISDISQYFDNKIVDISHWAIKPFAILASRFEEVILMDADAFYINNPLKLFDDYKYKELGSLFFKDRTLKFSKNKIKRLKWLKSFIINPLPETKKSRIWNKKSRDELESSTVVIHKAKALLGLLNICKLNEKMLRDKIIYRKVYGDKETFWLGFEMSRQNYNVIPNNCAAVGYIVSEKNKDGRLIKKICGNIGNIAHTLRNNELLFWNGHIVKDKKENINKIGIFEAYFIENNKTFWSNNHHCLTLNDNQEPTNFNENEKKIIFEILKREKKNKFFTNN